MTIQSKTRFGAFLLILACMSGLAGCRTFNSLTGMNSPTVPPPATGSYKIPGVDGATQPYYTPSGANGSSTPSGQWLPVQSRATTGADSTQWAMQNSNAVRTVGYNSTPDAAIGTGSSFATSDEAEQVVQSRLAAEQADSVSSTTRIPDQITPSASAQPLNPTPSASPTIQPGMPATSTLETPAFVLPTHQTQPVGSGVTNPPASIASPAVATATAVPTSPPPSSSGSPQPTLVPTPVSAPPSSAAPSSWTSQSNPAPSQPASLPVVGGSTSFRPRVKSQ